jgi:hypothetical protein
MHKNCTHCRKLRRAFKAASNWRRCKHHKRHPLARSGNCIEWLRSAFTFGGIASDMTKEVMEEHDLLRGVQTVMTLWQWSELFLQNGFRLAPVSPDRLSRSFASSSAWRAHSRQDPPLICWASGILRRGWLLSL